LREYIVSEAMAAMGIPTTRSLAAVTTGEPVYREDALPGAVLTRVAASHIRVGTFEFFAVRNDHQALVTLTTYALNRHYPDALGTGNDALALLDRVIDAQASLIARWMGVGFVHGVMNTDNTTISGETIDYGPCAFLDEYDPNKKFSSIDRGRRYAFGNQPRIAGWNVARLAEALLPLIASDEDAAVKLATEHLGRFPDLFEAAYARMLRSKLGFTREEEGDIALAKQLHELLFGVDYTIFYRRLAAAASDPSVDVASLFADRQAFGSWEQAWRARLSREDVAPQARTEAMRRVSPALIPRNHRVEEAIQAAVNNDYQPFERLVDALQKPYETQAELSDLAEPPRPEERVQETFCGT
jgi:serine/tyrosine/threonine adenylyltransferase